MRQKLAALFAVSVLGGMFDSIAQAQACLIPAYPFGESSTVSIASSNGSCTAESGIYIKYGATYKLHVIAQSSGSCTVKTWAGNGQCVDPTSVQPRALGVSPLRIDGVSKGPVNAVPNTVQYYNTISVVGTNSAGVNWLVSNANNGALGSHIFDTSTSLNLTSCNLPPPSMNSNSLTLNVTSCAPMFEIDQQDNIVHMVPGSTTYVYVPPSLQGTDLDTAVGQAIGSWNADLKTNGVAVEFVRTTDFQGVCIASANCIEVASGSVEEGGCSKIDIPTTAQSGGLPTGRMTLTISSSWNNLKNPWFPNGSLRRYLSHELGHALGLNENSCAVAASLMTPHVCGQATTTTSATITDQLPVKSTVYGGGTRNSCGF